MIEGLFKTLVFKDDRTKVLGRFAHPVEEGEGYVWYGGNMPLVISIDASMNDIEKLYPGIDTRDVKLILIKYKTEVIADKA